MTKIIKAKRNECRAVDIDSHIVETVVATSEPLVIGCVTSPGLQGPRITEASINNISVYMYGHNTDKLGKI